MGMSLELPIAPSSLELHFLQMAISFCLDDKYPPDLLAPRIVPFQYLAILKAK